MKTLVLNTLGEEVLDQVNALIKDKEVEVVDTSDMKIAHCMGCNQCWLKTPGICAIKDDYEKIIKKLVETENLWIVSDMHFGFLDYKGKRVMDRIVPMLNMTVGFRDGWMRHEMRYHRLNIGLLYKGDADQTLMEDWCKRTAANIGGHSLGAIALGNNAKHSVNEKEIKPAITGRPEHLVIINGSPRVAKFSNTDKIIHSFVKGLEETGITWELYNLSNRKEWDSAREAFLSHKHILIAFPLYVECIPSLMLEFLETLPTERKVPGQLCFLLHGGMDEGYEFRFCERILQELPAQLGCSYGGTLIRGGSFGIRTREVAIKAKIIAPYEKMGRLFAQSGNFLTPEAEKFTGPEQYPWLVRKMVSLLFLKKVNRGFEDFAKNWGCTRPLNDKPFEPDSQFDVRIENTILRGGDRCTFRITRRAGMKRLIAICGLDCEKCDAYIATKNDDQALREKTAKLWSELNNALILPEHINCDGCRMNGRKTVFCDRLCQIRQCALSKGFETCGDCPGKETCSKVGAIWQHNPQAKDNLER